MIRKKSLLLAVCVLFISGVLFSQGIIIDHTNTDITQIPDTWISKVKSLLKIHYAHTSHGEQISVGLERLSEADSKYAFYPDNCTMPQTTQYLSLMEGHYTYSACRTYVTPEYYWEGSEALNYTRAALNSNDINVSLWAWCTQLDYYSQAQTQAYLDAMSQLESEYPGVTFIYLTGNAQSEEQNRYDGNNQIRNYCRDNNKILFDFADLDCWYNGEQHTQGGIPMEHPQYNGDQAGHTTYESCDNKGKAFWWLLARVAGWDGGTGGGGINAPPFGNFETPADGSNVRSSIAVTGWALDDTAVQNVKIYRAADSGLAYIGDATFVEGARPDIEQQFPGYPYNDKAGWGYMLLTNFLPNSGNGTFTLHAIAADSSGQEVTLGTKTITCDNANAVKPFGAIDTPGPGGTASGSDFRNVGWALTPMPNQIPDDGSTINVYVNGVYLGHPVYDVYREDIASLFPGYANSNGAAAYFYLDTTVYDNGVHTIYWTAEDSAGNSDGIGSRYFTVQNTPGDRERMTEGRGTKDEGRRTRDEERGTKDEEGRRDEKLLFEIPVNPTEPASVIKGFNRNSEPQKIYPDETGNITIEIRELERIEIRLAPSVSPVPWEGYLILGNQLKALPVGSTLDKDGGIFYWQPGAGFVGNYALIFANRETNRLHKINIKIKYKGL